MTHGMQADSRALTKEGCTQEKIYYLLPQLSTAYDTNAHSVQGTKAHQTVTLNAQKEAKLGHSHLQLTNTELYYLKDSEVPKCGFRCLQRFAVSYAERMKIPQNRL